MDITNKSGKPLSVPLPGGKKLYLSPGKTGQVNDKALKHPPLAKLLESGDLTKSDGSFKPRASGGTNSNASSGQRHGGSGAMRQSGDR